MEAAERYMHDHGYDPNFQLEPFVIGMIAGAIDWPRFAELPGTIGWRLEHADVDGIHAIVATSPSGIRWRLRAEMIDPGE